ncbi:hypothetical protein [Vibrio parahaemolyticus]|uniref:hypothetical protein n=1 Tax=Vibrio parahaemolyticus TaxID=670 RepID=UPI0038923595
MKNEVVATEVAVKDFERFCETWGVEAPVEPKEDSTKLEKDLYKEMNTSFQLIKLAMVGYISKGILVVSENGDFVTQHCQYPPVGGQSKDPFIFKYQIPSLGDMFELDKANGTMASKAANIAVLTRNSRSKLAMLDPRDLKFGEPVVQLFFSLLA